MTDWREPFLAAIREHPADDGVRLTYADYLEERGECDYAEFVRTQIELAKPPSIHDVHALERRQRELWHKIGNDLFQDIGIDFSDVATIKDSLMSAASARTGYILHGKNGFGNIELIWRRGFVAVVRLPSAALLGRECERCRESGWDGAPDCKLCGGTGHIPGIAAALGRLPGLERVELSDKRPDIHQVPPQHQREFGVENFNWWIQVMNGIPYDLPDDLFLRLEGDLENLRSDIRRAYPSASAATDSLAIAAAQWCRQQADEAAKKEGVTV